MALRMFDREDGERRSLAWWIAELAPLGFPYAFWGYWQAGRAADALGYGWEARLAEPVLWREAMTWAALSGALQLPIFFARSDRLGWIRRALMPLAFLAAIPMLLAGVILGAFLPIGILVILAAIKLALTEPGFATPFLCYALAAPAAIFMAMRAAFEWLFEGML